jgi:catechol 2,3-dioxygenase-like lactoylglutathione lyase family enzyme
MSFSIEHVTIRCRDIESSIDYFTRMFDAEIMFRRQLDQGKQIVFMHIGDSMLELMDMGPAAEPVDPREHYGVHHFGIKVDDFDAVYEDLCNKGAEFLGEPFEPIKGIRLVFLREPNGGVIELASRDQNVIQEAMEQGTVNW